MESRSLIWVLATVGLVVTALQAGAVQPAYVVIADPDTVSNRRLTRESVARIFLRRQMYWSGGKAIQPVNLPPAHALRREFSLDLLGGSPESFEDYWRDLYFNGIEPPHVVASEEAVALFVSSTPGAIGYLSSCLPGHRYAVVLQVGDVVGCPK